MSHSLNSSSIDIGVSVESSNIDSRRLRKARLKARSSRSFGSLHWLHWLILLLSLAITLFVYHGAEQAQSDKQQITLNNQVDEVMTQFSERIQRYEDALWGGTAALHARGDRMDHAGWKAFADHLQIEKRLPGVLGIGVIDILDESQIDTYLHRQRRQRPDFQMHGSNPDRLRFPITYIEPEAVNARAVGLDLGFERRRRQGIIRALSTGKPVISAPIELVQDDRHKAGFLFIAPFNALYADELDIRSELDAHSISRLVYIPFVAEDLFHGALGKRKRQVRVRISDGDAVLYDEIGDATVSGQQTLSARRQFERHDRSWTFDFVAAQNVDRKGTFEHPVLVLLAGIGIDGLLFLLFLTLSRSARRMSDNAAELASLSGQLEVKALKLERSNDELQSFAYVASHDLKTPLRGIDFLASCLSEDLEDYLKSETANPDVERNLLRLGKQTNRMNHLIEGVLDYAMVGHSEEALERVNVHELLQTIAEDLQLSETQISIEGDMPVLHTYAVRLEQVFANLIGNAMKYHHDPECLHIRIVCRAVDDGYEFSVRDNGPGIDPRFHNRVFEVFQTLQPRDEIESTGVGLSIVRKSVEALGGSITVDSQPGHGANFVFTWPDPTPTDTAIDTENKEASE